MKHLVVDDVLNGVPGHGCLIKDSADDNRIVRRIVMPKDASSLGRAPTHSRPPQQSMKEAAVQILKHRLQIVDASLRRMQPLAPAHLPYQVCFTRDLVTGHIFSIASRVASIDGL